MPDSIISIQKRCERHERREEFGKKTDCSGLYYESTEVNRRTMLHVPSGTPWSNSSDTHQVVEI